MDADRLLADALLATHPGDAARLLEDLTPEGSAELLAGSAPNVAATVLQHMASESAAECLACLAPERAGAILATLPLDTAAILLRRFEAPTRERLLASAPRDFATHLSLILDYPEGTAGALMDPRALVLPDDIEAREALARVRRAPHHIHYYLYVVDRTKRLVGVMSLRELMLAPAKAPLASVMQPQVAGLSAQAERTAIVAHPSWRELHALPVVDDAGRFVGVIRHETLRRLEEEAPPTQPAADALGTVLTIGELFWVGLAGVLGDLVATISAPPGNQQPDREDDHGT